MSVRHGPPLDSPPATGPRAGRLSWLRLAVAGLSFALLAHGAAADPPDADAALREAVEFPGYVLFGESGAPGLVLVAVRGASSLVLGYGETERGNGRAPDGRSLFRLNSVSKVLATEALASLVAEGRLRLTDTLARHAGGRAVQQVGPRPITLLDLATYSAGLPREIGDAPADRAPRTWPTRSERWRWLDGNPLRWAPGTMAAYSNVGFDLLGDAMEEASGQAYPALLRDRVTAPAGMTDTTVSPTEEQCARLMTGTGLGGAGPCVDTAATAASGGLYSTGDDMRRWLRRNLGDPEGTRALSHAVYRPRQAMPIAAGFDEAAPMSGLGLGWVISDAAGTRPLLVAKSGAGVGFMSYVAFAPGRDAGVFVVMNRLDFAPFAGLVAGANALLASLATR
ncbi:D-alanyl-D-alanine-carboxypeptidase/endopeptidase AmpH [Roseomonas nepalensis]|uniref:D-alanyl-D-alanine-carboxypeptidase/endopeptidase AmpH n=1 Tax=Muricoccus nepalensis TaxID=1854500 RepID=A0A502F4Q1_9PROT|nr:D-alanyl-D-alanine-carboxypeptidase/endopeptidase AmpH [Roseomonas nepalensis]TPG44214.1 D-alanyl-D-alanine-carboxypeptidase/endopeptidase AmpH [Roseomonas nepalensis]